MKKSKLVDAKRCVIMPTLKEWYKDPKIARLLLTLNPSLIFNVDETHITLRKSSPGKVLSKNRQQPSACG